MSDLEKHFNNIVIAVEAYKGTKQEHVNLEIALSAIKNQLFKNELFKNDDKAPIDSPIPANV